MTETDTQVTFVKFQALIYKIEGYMNILRMHNFFIPLVYMKVAIEGVSCSSSANTCGYSIYMYVCGLAKESALSFQPTIVNVCIN